MSRWAATSGRTDTLPIPTGKRWGCAGVVPWSPRLSLNRLLPAWGGSSCGARSTWPALRYGRRTSAVPSPIGIRRVALERQSQGSCYSMGWPLQEVTHGRLHPARPALRLRRLGATHLRGDHGAAPLQAPRHLRQGCQHRLGAAGAGAGARGAVSGEHAGEESGVQPRRSCTPSTCVISTRGVEDHHADSLRGGPRAARGYPGGCRAPRSRLR